MASAEAPFFTSIANVYGRSHAVDHEVGNDLLAKESLFFDTAAVVFSIDFPWSTVRRHQLPRGKLCGQLHN